MPDGTVETRCPACSEPVFDGGNVVRCSRCEALHHEPCWVRLRACAARTSCRGKPQAVIVVRVPQPLDAAAVADLGARTAMEHVSEHVLPRLEELIRSRVAAADLDAIRDLSGERLGDVERAVREHVSSETGRLRRELETLRTSVGSASASVRALSAGQAALAQELTQATQSVLDARLRAIEETLGDLSDRTLAALETVAQGLHQELDAARFALDDMRRPFPWDTSGAKCVEPAGRSDS